MTATAGDSLLYADSGAVARLRDRLVTGQVGVLAQHSPFYRTLLREAGVAPGDVQSIGDLSSLPRTSKTDFLEAPEQFRLDLPAAFPVEERSLAYVIYTTGTASGAPAPLYVTSSDDWDYLVHAQRCAQMVGLDQSDVIANLFPLTPFPMGARIRADRTAAAVGASIFQGHTGARHDRWPVHRRMDEALDLVAQHRATVLWGVAGFVRRLLARAAEKGMRLPHLRWCFITGEASSEAALENLRHWLRAVDAPSAQVANRYGSTEGWSMISCADGQGWHNPSPESTYLEVVDPETGLPVPDGETGHLLITHLRARGTAFLRYAVGDVVSLTREPCPDCGRTSERLISQPHRVRDLVKVNGTLVNLAVLGDALTRVPGVTEHRVVLTRTDERDELSQDLVVLEIATLGRDDEAMVAAVREHVRSLVHVTPKVRVVPADTIFDPARDAKPQRLVDRRHDHPTGGQQ